jgi:hypothetical protein
MKEQPQIITTIRNLIATQTPDVPWFQAAAEVIGCAVETFDKAEWWTQVWLKEWGELELIPDKEQITVAWHRPDGAQSLASDEHHLPLTIRILRFALLGCLTTKLKEAEELSFVIPGYPREWRQCKVYMDGHEVQQAVMADAVLNQVDAIVKVGGKVVPDKVGHLLTHKMHGAVRIVVYNESQLFF